MRAIILLLAMFAVMGAMARRKSTVTTTIVLTYVTSRSRSRYTRTTTYATTQEVTVTETVTALPPVTTTTQVVEPATTSTSTSVDTTTVFVTSTPPPPPSTSTATVIVTSTPPPPPSTSTATVIVTSTPPPPPSTSTATVIVTTTRPPPTTSTLTATVTVTTTTAAVPTVVYFKTTCQKAVQCPRGTKYLSNNRGCMNTFMDGKQHSSTCTVSSCCTQKSKLVTRTTTCAAAKVKCPQFTLPLTDKNNVSAPCVETWNGNKLVSTACSRSTCCTKVRTNRQVPCNQVIKCKTYKVNRKTGAIVECRTQKSSSQMCTVGRCCGRV